MEVLNRIIKRKESLHHGETGKIPAKKKLKECRSKIQDPIVEGWRKEYSLFHRSTKKKNPITKSQE
jgi:hypothetical protein